MQILTVEDDPMSLQHTASGLAELGHEVTTARDGDSAWALLETMHFPLIVTDWRMPRVDGLELCRRIRGAHREKYSYVILLTGVHGRSEYRQAMEAGVDDFLSKPLDLERLTIRVRVAERILGLQREVRQLQGLLPICAYCRSIRDEGDHWQPMERFLEERTNSELSHGICPACYEKELLTLPKPAQRTGS